MTLKIPPKNEHFQNFHQVRTSPPMAANHMQPNLSGQTGLGSHGMFPIMLPPFFPPQTYGQPYIPAHAETPRNLNKHGIPSSPTSASSDNYMFPSISAFFEDVTHWPEATHRNLDGIEAKLTMDAIYQIDELEKVPAEKLSQAFGLLWGDAQFLEKLITKGIQKVKKGKEGQHAKRTRVEQ